MEIYHGSNGMILIRLSENEVIEVSPTMAKRMRDQLSRAISISFTNFLKGDDEV